MSQGRKGKVNYRCPTCFDREWDIDMLYDKDKDEYYCLRCNYIGREGDILARYQHFKTKYKFTLRRFTLADFLNEPTGNCEPQTDADSAYVDPLEAGEPGPAAGDRVGSKTSFQPLLIYESDKRAPLVARSEACVVRPRGKIPESTFVRTLSGESGMAVRSLAPESLRFGGDQEGQCRSFMDVIPVATLPPGDYSFEAALDPPLRKDPGRSRIRFLLRGEEIGEGSASKPE